MSLRRGFEVATRELAIPHGGRQHAEEMIADGPRDGRARERRGVR